MRYGRDYRMRVCWEEGSVSQGVSGGDGGGGAELWAWL